MLGSVRNHPVVMFIKRTVSPSQINSAHSAVVSYFQHRDLPDKLLAALTPTVSIALIILAHDPSRSPDEFGTEFAMWFFVVERYMMVWSAGSNSAEEVCDGCEKEEGTC